MTIAVTAPDGSTVNFPDGTPERKINEVMTKQFAPAPTEEGITLGGAVKSLAAGGAEGLIGLAGMPGDIAELGTQALGVPNKLSLPTSAQIQGSIEKNITGPFYQSRGPIESSLRTAGSFAPALIGGPESLITKLASRVALPTVGSELAGAASEGTAAEPYAKLGGALAGTVLGHKLTAPHPPQLEGAIQGVKDAADLGYKVPEITGVEYKPKIIKQVAQNAQQDLRSSKFNDSNAKQTFDLLDDLKTPVGPTPGTMLGQQFGGQKAATALAQTQKGVHTYEDIQTTRTMLSKVAGQTQDGKPTIDAAAATKAIKFLDQYVESAPQSHLAKGNARDLADAINRARADYASGMSAQRVMEKAIETPELQAAAANSGKNIGNITRQKQRQILTSAKGARGLTQDEQDMLAANVKGTFVQNRLREVGNLLGGGGGLGQLLTAGGGYMATGSPFGLTAPLVGKVAHGLANRMAVKGAEKVVRQILTRSPSYQTYLAGLPADQRSLAKSLLAVGLLGVRPQGLLSQ